MNPLIDRRTSLWSLLVALIIGSAGGYGMCLSFPGTALWYLMFPALAALFWLLLNLPAGAAAWGSIAWSCAFFFPLITWIVDSTKALAPWIALATVQVTWILLWALLSLRARRSFFWGRPAVFAFMLAVTFVGIEQVRAHFPWHGFAWGILGYAQVAGPLKRFIPWLGEVGMSLLISLLALALAILVSLAHKLWERVLSVSGIVVLVVAAILLPDYYSAVPAADAKPQELQITAVQGNVSKDYPADLEQDYRVLQNSVAETDRITGQPDFVVWGEQSTDIDPRTDQQARDLVIAAAKRVNAPILVGMVPVVDHKYRHNDIFIVYPDGRISAAYTKQRPVPFGEYIPARDFFAKLSKTVEQVAVDMRSGTQPAVMTLQRADGTDVRLAVGICFEVAIDAIMRQGIAHGGEIFIVPTNNASFGMSDESVQQLQMVQFRALEYHRAAVSSSINGVSALIAADGSIMRQTQLFTAANISAQMPLYRDLTPAFYLQPYAPKAAMILFAVWGVLVLVLPRKRPRAEH